MESSKITFVSDRDGTFDLFVMYADGSNQDEYHPYGGMGGRSSAMVPRRHVHRVLRPPAR